MRRNSKRTREEADEVEEAREFTPERKLAVPDSSSVSPVTQT